MGKSMGATSKTSAVFDGRDVVSRDGIERAVVSVASEPSPTSDVSKRVIDGMCIHSNENHLGAMREG